MATQTETTPITPSAPTGSNPRVTKVTSYVNQQLEKTRRQVKSTDLIGGLMTVLAIALSFLILGAIWDAWIWPLSVTGRWLCLGMLVGGCGLFGLFAILPLLMKRINPDYAAHMIESAQPNFKNSVLNYVSLRKKSDTLNAAVFDAVSRQAATDLSTVPVDGTVDRTKLIRLGFVLIGLMLFVVGYKILSPKDPLQTLARILAPSAKIAQPALVQISEVAPGDVKIFFGEQLEITAVVRGSHNPNEVSVFYSTIDGQSTNQRISMVPSDVPNRYRAVLNIAGTGIQQSLKYHVVARDGVSPDFEVTVQANPTIAVESLVLTPPPYTKLPELVLSGQGNIDVIEGTKVTVHAVANLPIKTAYIELLNVVEPVGVANPAVASDNRFRVVRSIEMLAQGTSATAKFSALLNSARQKPLATHYRLRFVSTNDDRNLKPNLYPIKITPDLAPEIVITNPALREVFVAENGAVAIEIEANDLDFEITSVALHLDHQSVHRLNQNLELKTYNAKQRATARYLLKPSEHRLKAGDKAVFFATANDNRMAAEDATRPDPNVSRTENYTLTVVAAEKRAAGDPQQSNQPIQPDDAQQQPNPDNQDQQESGNEAPSDDGTGTGQKSSSESGTGESESGDAQSNDSQQAEPESGESGSSEPDAGQADAPSPKEDGSKSADSPSSENPDPSADNSKGEQSKGSGEPADAESGNEPGQQSEPNGGSEDANQSPAASPDSAGNGSQSQPADSDSNSPPGSTDSPSPGQQPSQSNSNPNSAPNQSPDGSNDPSNDDGSQNATERQDENLTQGNQQPLNKDASPGEQFRRLEKVLDKEPSSTDPAKKLDSNRPTPNSQDNSPKQDAADKPDNTEPAPDSQNTPTNQAPTDNQSNEPSGQSGDPQENQSSGQSKSAEGSNSTESKKSDSGKSDSGKSDADKSDADKSDAGKSDAEKSGAEKSDAEKSDSEKSDAGKSGAEKSDSEKSDSGSPSDSKQNQSPPESSDSSPDASPSDSAGGGQGESSGQSGSPSPGESAAASPSNKPPTDASSKSTSSSASGMGTGGSEFSSEEIAQEEVNLAHSKKTTDLILDKLDQQKYDPDPKLLEEMNWTEEDLNNFLRRWQEMKAAAEQGDLKAKAKYEKSLKGLDLRPNADSRAVKQNKDKIQDLTEDNAVIQPPPELAPDFNATLRDLNRRQ